MKKLALIAALLAAMMVIQPALAAEIASTNIAGTNFHVAWSADDAAADVGTMVFFNGSLMNRDVDIVNGRTLISVAWFTSPLSFSAKVEVDESGENVDITFGDTVVSITSGKREATVNGERFELDVEPYADGYFYVPLRFVCEQFGATVEWYDGESDSGAGTRILERGRQIVVSLYPEDYEDVLTKSMARDTLWDKLVYAYEKKFGAYAALTEDELNAGVTDDAADPDFREDTLWRKWITELEVTEANDRYIVMRTPMYDYWVDRYTSDIYTVYYGETIFVEAFDADSEDALTLAG
ncbi:MAG: copper amine oxidase N-terminal domain-containing protein [Oscillospiraceae bacterium]|nr:copper amine oxidase N-terminal domain-containing protein [Oscillospiraceae bacterium]